MIINCKVLSVKSEERDAKSEEGSSKSVNTLRFTPNTSHSKLKSDERSGKNKNASHLALSTSHLTTPNTLRFTGETL